MDTKNFEASLLGRRQTALSISVGSSKGLKGPLRVLRLCFLGILLPCFLIALILYMRYRVYVEQLYPLAISDMRMLDNRISTTWCQRQLVKTNATFNAFLLPSTPKIAFSRKPMTMVRHLELEDDSKEYWGFYLLKGSSVTISTCARWPGSSLIVIRGHKHLHQCAYIGDNSSEELEELAETLLGKHRNQDSRNKSDESDAPSNVPSLMRRHRSDVRFHNPSHNHSDDRHKLPHNEFSDDAVNDDITDHKAMRKILDSLNGLKALSKSPAVPRNVSVTKADVKNIGLKDQMQLQQQQQPVLNVTKSTVKNSTQSESEEVYAEVLKKLYLLGAKGDRVLAKLAERYAKVNEKAEEILDLEQERLQEKTDILSEITRRKRELMLEILNDNDDLEEDANLALEEGFTPDGIADHHWTINETTLNDGSNSEFWSSFSSSEEALLNCEGLILNLPLTPHTRCLRSGSENEVEGASLDNKITYKVPNNGYYFFVFNSENEVQTNYIRLRFHIEKTVYNVTNPISQCNNTNSTQTTPNQCAMDLKFFSSEKLVMELPVSENAKTDGNAENKSDDEGDMWNQEFVVVSICEPRTSVYIICVLAVPILVILFAFQ